MKLKRDIVCLECGHLNDNTLGTEYYNRTRYFNFKCKNCSNEIKVIPREIISPSVQKIKDALDNINAHPLIKEHHLDIFSIQLCNQNVDMSIIMDRVKNLDRPNVKV